MKIFSIMFYSLDQIGDLNCSYECEIEEIMLKKAVDIMNTDLPQKFIECNGAIVDITKFPVIEFCEIEGEL